MLIYNTKIKKRNRFVKVKLFYIQANYLTRYIN